MREKVAGSYRDFRHLVATVNELPLQRKAAQERDAIRRDLRSILEPLALKIFFNSFFNSLSCIECKAGRATWRPRWANGIGSRCPAGHGADSDKPSFLEGFKEVSQQCEVTLGGFTEFLSRLRLPSHIAGLLLQWQDSLKIPISISISMCYIIYDILYMIYYIFYII